MTENSAMTEAERHISNARVTLEVGSERSFVNDTFEGLLAEIERLQKRLWKHDLAALDVLGNGLDARTLNRLEIASTDTREDG